MNICLNCGSENPPSKGNRKRKYCSKQCANKYLHELQRQRHPSYGDPTWKKKTTLQIDKHSIEKQKRLAEYEWYMNSDEWHTAKEVSELVGVNIWYRVKILGIKPHRCYWSGAIDFFSNEMVDQIKAHDKQIKVLASVPKGYLTREEAHAYLGYAQTTFTTMINHYGAPEHKLQKSRCVWRHLYTKKSLDEWKKNIDTIRKQKSEETRIRQALKRKEREEQLRLEREELERKTKGLIKSTEAAKILGLKTISTSVRSRLNVRRIKPGLWFDPKEVHALKKQRDTEAKKKAREKAKKKRFRNMLVAPLKLTSLTRTVLREKKAKERYALYTPKHILKSKAKMKNVAMLKEVWRYHEEVGIAIHYTCNICNKSLPYMEFYINVTYSTGRRPSCTVCSKKRPSNRKKISSDKKTALKYTAAFITSIRFSLSKKRKEYCTYSAAKVWHNIEKYLGYTREDLIAHIESQFEPWMKWENNGNPKNIKDKKWQLDHIKPKVLFEYSRMSDLDFIECWSLANLRPIESRMNLIKSDKKLRGKLNASFRNGILQKNNCGGVWNYLEYSVEEARTHIENQFDQSMNWDNHGSYWHIDHVVPQAYLAYIDPYSDNFKKCWELKNIKPLKISENISKGSRYENILWHYNDIE